MMPVGAAALPSLVCPQVQLLQSPQGALSQGPIQVPLSGLFPVPGLVHAAKYFSTAWNGPCTVSALTGEYCSLAQLAQPIPCPGSPVCLQVLRPDPALVCI